MAAFAGRDVKLFRNNQLLVAGRTKSFELNREPIDITSDDDDGYRGLMSKAGVRTLDVQFSGILKNSQFIELAYDADDIFFGGVEIEFSGIGWLLGDFYLSSISDQVNHDDAVIQTLELHSNGSFEFFPEFLLALDDGSELVIDTGQTLVVN